MYPDYLASSRIEIPDPDQECFYGQQIVIFYRYPRIYRGEKTIALTIRYQNKQVERLCFPLHLRDSYLIFRLVGEDYCEKGGILAYKVELMHDDQIVKNWKHHLYVDLIEMESNAT